MTSTRPLSAQLRHLSAPPPRLTVSWFLSRERRVGGCRGSRISSLEVALAPDLSKLHRHYFRPSHPNKNARANERINTTVSDAPSYHSTVPNPEPIPPYSPPANNNNISSNNRTAATGSTQYPTSLLPAAPAVSRSGNSTPQPHRTTGLPPIPPAAAVVPRLDQFRIPTWSTVHTNPTLNNVARRRMNQGADPVAHLRRFMSERMAEEEAAQRARDFRPLEDPYLVGEEAAANARRERLARESGEEILWDEDRRWNRFLGRFCSLLPTKHPGARNANHLCSTNADLGRSRSQLEELAPTPRDGTTQEAEPSPCGTSLVDRTPLHSRFL